ncbi:MAG: dihydroxyacetone kinase subunit DhaL [Eubacteriales bacterium]|nr:dihydroxyacetone kinase subunit DhaL [Eubacteriales bacterium]
MNAQDVKKAFSRIAETMQKNRAYLIGLDQQNGDGDLGISMAEGFLAVKTCLDNTEEKDLGMIFVKASSALNENAPSSLGTILSIGLMGAAKPLKGSQCITVSELADALQAGNEKIMERAKSRPGEKTILDALCPAVGALKEYAGKESPEAFCMAAKAAANGAEETKNMLSKHGRAAYYGEKSLGVLDGGAVVGKLIFEAIAESDS